LQDYSERPLKNVQFCSSSRKAKISTTGIHSVFRGLKFESDDEIGQKGALCKGLSDYRGIIMLTDNHNSKGGETDETI